MASEAILHTHSLGKVLPNGHLEIPKTVVESIGWKDGDEVVVALHKVTAAGGLLLQKCRRSCKSLLGRPAACKKLWKS
jgi:hypothetical protein